MYQRFFTHLAAVLDQPLLETELGTSELIVGSDEEKALVKAVKCSFPDAKLTMHSAFGRKFEMTIEK